MVTTTIYTNNDCYSYEDRPNDTRDSIILQIRGQSGYRRRTYIEFDITSAPAAAIVTDVKLYMYVSVDNTSGYNNMTGRFSRITSTAWDESTLTWNNAGSQAPVTTTNQVTHYMGQPPIGWYNYSITNLYKDAKNAGNELGIKIMDNNEYGDTNVQWSSKEGSNNPYIIITYSTNDYYVKTTGNDSLDGSSWANAWKTINKAATTVADGVTVHIGFGTYDAEPASNKIAPQNIGSSGIYYLPETATTGGGTGTVSVEQNA